MQKQLGVAPAGATDTATKGYADNATIFEPHKTQSDTSLLASTDFIARGHLEVASTTTLTLPGTSTLEIAPAVRPYDLTNLASSAMPSVAFIARQSSGIKDRVRHSYYRNLANTAFPSTTEDTGQTVSYSSATLAHIINNGYGAGSWLTFARGAGANFIYRDFGEPTPITCIGGKFAFALAGAGSYNGAVTFGILNDTHANVQSSVLGRLAVHWVLGPTGWYLQKATNASGSLVFSYVTHSQGSGIINWATPLGDSARVYRAEVLISDGFAFFLLPDGTVAWTSDPDVTTNWLGGYAFHELAAGEASTDAIPGWIETWADTGYQPWPGELPMNGADVVTRLAAKGDASTNTTTSVDSEVALFSSTTGKLLKRATGTGMATLTAGVLGTTAAPSGAVVGDTDTQTETNKTLSDTFMGIDFDAAKTQRDTTLLASTDLSAWDVLEIAAATVLTIPATSSLEIVPVIRPNGSASDPAATPSTLVRRDVNGSFSANVVNQGATSTPSSANTITMDITSSPIQITTGSTNQTIKLPPGVPMGARYVVMPNTNATTTVQSSNGGGLATLVLGTKATFTALIANPIATGDWGTEYLGIAFTTGKKLSVSNSLTLAGTDNTTMTFPGSSDTVVGLAAAQIVTTKLISDTFMGKAYDTPKTQRDTTLLASTDFVARGALEIVSTTALEVPATSSLEIITYMHAPASRAGVINAPGASYAVDVGLYESLLFVNVNAALALSFTGTCPTPYRLLLGFRDDGTGRAITWDAATTASSGVATLLSTTVAGKTHWVTLIFDGSKFACLAVDATGY